MEVRNQKTVRIFLMDGEPAGLRTAELSNWTGKAVIIPRHMLKVARQEPEWQRPAVYFLVGQKEEGDLQEAIYVGSAEDLVKRLSEHDRTKEFWSVAIGLISKDDNLTKTGVSYLESRVIEEADRSGRYKLENENRPKPPNISKMYKAEIEEFFENSELLLSGSGLPFMSRNQNDQNAGSRPVFYCKRVKHKTHGKGHYENGAFLMYADSVVLAESISNEKNMKLRRMSKERHRRIVKELEGNGVLEAIGDGRYKFIKNYMFKTPSGAASFIVGSAVGGWDVWKTKDDKTLDEVYRSPGNEGEEQESLPEE